MKSKKQAKRLLHRKFLEKLLALSEVKTTLQAKLLPSAPDFVDVHTGISGLYLRYVVGEHKTRVELYIYRPKAETNEIIFDELLSHKDKINDNFGGILKWERLPGRRGCRIACYLLNGGSRDNKVRWQAIQKEMIDAMVRFEKALSPFIPQLMHLK